MAIAMNGRTFSSLSPSALWYLRAQDIWRGKIQNYLWTGKVSDVIELREALLKIEWDLIDVYPFAWNAENAKRWSREMRSRFRRNPTLKKKLIIDLERVGYSEPMVWK